MNYPDPQKIAAGLMPKADASELGFDLERFGRWLTREDEYSDIVISCRIRLARNLKGYAFPNRATHESLLEILEKVKRACANCKSLQDSAFHDIQCLSDINKKYLVERRLASPQLVDEADRPGLLVTSADECLSVMVNEEDHLRLQCLEAGLRIDEAWRIISILDDELGEALDYSYSSKFGYLTSCPTNIGTGLRVSFFAHVPALALRDEISQVISNLPTSEIAVRGFYGEGTEAVGDIFQISNQLTLGRTETNVIERLMKIAREISELERKAREDLFVHDATKLEDTVFRAVGILANARILTSLEAMKRLSAIRLGQELGMIKALSRIDLNRLMILVQPAHLQKMYGKSLPSDERDVARADFIKQNLQI